jgi:hypothetical protein
MSTAEGIDRTAIDRAAWSRWQRRSLAIGAIVSLACVLGALLSPAQFFRAYLTAYLFYLGIALGSMVLLMIYHLVGGAWGFLLRRILEAAMRTLPLLAALFVPIACGMGYLYLWAQPEAVAGSEKLQHQQFYLNPEFFCIRAAVYFAIWLGMAWRFSSWSRQEDQTGNPRLAWKSLKLSGYGAVAYGISIHFASVDWVMSLQPVFRSTIWGPLFAVGQLLSALAFALVVLPRLTDRPPLAEVVSAKVRGDLGNLLLTLLITWAYLAWFQYMLIWIANMPADVVWYLPRTGGGWLWVVWALGVLHFGVPFFLLLMRSVKRNSRAVAWIAGLLLLMQLVFMNYQVLPAFSADTLGQHWMDFLMPIAIGGLWLACFLWQLQGRPWLAAHDYNRATAIHLRQLDEEEAAREEALAHG